MKYNSTINHVASEVESCVVTWFYSVLITVMHYLHSDA